jgi:hypothetical protein
MNAWVRIKKGSQSFVISVRKRIYWFNSIRFIIMSKVEFCHTERKSLCWAKPNWSIEKSLPLFIYMTRLILTNWQGFWLIPIIANYSFFFSTAALNLFFVSNCLINVLEFIHKNQFNRTPITSIWSCINSFIMLSKS